MATATATTISDLLDGLTASVETAWERVADRHQHDAAGRCGSCGETWPCRTRRYATSGL